MQNSTGYALQLLLTVLAPPPGVVFAVQRGRAELLPPYTADAESVAFAITVRLGPALADGSFNFRGPYLCNATYAALHFSILSRADEDVGPEDETK